MVRNADEESETVEEGIAVSNRFFLFLLLGFVLVFVGITVILVAALLYGGGSANFGAVIFIGPIPIVVGAGPDATLMVLLGVIFAVLSVIMFMVMRRRSRCAGG
jgi:uncharacterized membrane protein